MRHALALAASLIAVPACAATPAPSRLDGLMVLRGTCRALLVGGRDRTSACAGKIANTSYTDGRTGFYFITDDDVILTFSGMGDRQVKTDAGTVVMPIDSVIVGSKGRSDKLRAVGTCRFSNPYDGPAPISCEASAAGGRYRGDFMTDGGMPDRRTF